MKYSMAKDQKEQRIERIVRLMFEAELYSMKYLKMEAIRCSGFQKKILCFQCMRR